MVEVPHNRGGFASRAASANVRPTIRSLARSGLTGKIGFRLEQSMIRTPSESSSRLHRPHPWRVVKHCPPHVNLSPTILLPVQSELLEPLALSPSAFRFDTTLQRPSHAAGFLQHPPSCSRAPSQLGGNAVHGVIQAQVCNQLKSI